MGRFVAVDVETEEPTWEIALRRRFPTLEKPRLTAPFH